jgi:hypothetical protein
MVRCDIYPHDIDSSVDIINRALYLNTKEILWRSVKNIEVHHNTNFCRLHTPLYYERKHEPYNAAINP